LVTCGVLSNEKLGRACLDFVPSHLCVAECTLATTCTSIEDAFCRQESNDYGTCLSGCGDTEVYECADGEPIPIEYLCDGYVDCDAGEDEVDCFTNCENGDVVSAAYICDYVVDCEDGSDEANCPEVTCEAPPEP
jgi:hypothetical protein